MPRTQHATRLPVALAVGLACAVATVSARAQHAELHATTGICADGPTHTLERSDATGGLGPGPGTTHVRIVDGADTEHACVDIGAHHRWSSTRITVGGEHDWLELVVDDVDRALFRLVDGALTLVWAGTAASPGDATDTVDLVDLDGDGASELVRHRLDPVAPPCGRDDLYLQPAVFDLATGAFRDAVIVPPAAQAPTLEVRPSGPDDRYAEDARVVVVSSSARVDGWPSRDRGVVELTDDDPSTAWLEGRPGTGVGAWVRIDAEAGVPLTGIVVDNGDGAGVAGPTRWVVVFGDGTAHRATTPPNGRFALRFDPPTASGCAALVAAGLVDGATTFAVGGMSPRTVLDTMAPDDALDTVVDVVAARSGDVRVGQATRLFARLAADAPEAALTTIDDADATTQAALVAALGEVAATRAGLAARVADGRFDDETARAWLPTADPGDADDRTALLARIGPGDPLAVAALGRLGDPTSDDETMRMLDALADATADEVDARLDALDTPDPMRFAEVVRRSGDGEADIRIRMLRLAVRLGTAPPAWVDQAAIDAVRANLAHDNGTVARLAIAVAGLGGFGGLRDTVAVIAIEDPADELRVEAFVALGRLDHDAPELDAMLDDPSPTVRLAALTRFEPRFAAEAMQRRLATETWPAIREALMRQLAASPTFVAEALMQARTDDEAVAMLDALPARPDEVSADAWLAAAEHFGGSPRVLWRLVERADGCTDPSLRPWIEGWAADAPARGDEPPSLEAPSDARPNVYDRVNRAAARALERCAEGTTESADPS